MFPPDAVRRIRFIKRAQELGFSLSEIRELLSIQIDTKRECSDVKRLAKAKISDINAKIQSLEAMKRVLEGLTEICPGQGPSSKCPILESIDSERAIA
jgi:MerR family mercuric resistance operon transcriptional regulator